MTDSKKDKKSEKEASSETKSMFQNGKEWFIEEYKSYQRPSDVASRTLGCSIFVYLAGKSVEYSVHLLLELYFSEKRFWLGSKDYGRRGAAALCQTGESLLLSTPQTVSETLADDNEASFMLVGSFFTFAALLVLASRLGNPSDFPVPVGHGRSIFNTLRVIAPVVALFFVPRVPAIGQYAELKLGGHSIINMWHGLFAVVSFVFAPLFEIIHGGMNLNSFFKLGGDKFIPALSSDKPNLFSLKLYKTLWVTLTILQVVLSVLTLFIATQFLPWAGKTGNPQSDACGSLRTLLTFTLEETMIGLFGVYFTVLALSQMCESSGRRLSSLFYILPLMYFSFGAFEHHFSKYLLTYDMNANYLAILDMPESGWSEPLPVGCTFLLDVATVPDNCYDLPKNP